MEPGQCLPTRCPQSEAQPNPSTGSGQGAEHPHLISVCPYLQVGMRDADYIAAFLQVLLPVALEVLGVWGLLEQGSGYGWGVRAGGLM